MIEKRTGRPWIIEARYQNWKALIPVHYDWIANKKLFYPSLSCRWGPRIKETTYSNYQKLYFSQQTYGSVPNTLVIADIEVVKRMATNVFATTQFDNNVGSLFVKDFKTIIHPGMVSRIRELPTRKNIVATHTEGPDVYIWDVNAESHCADFGAAAACPRPDLVLKGHQDNVEFALAMCGSDSLVLSGGKDTSVVLWSIKDHNSASSSKSPGSGDEIIHSPNVLPRGLYQGHQDTVKDVQFSPSSAQEFCSVGDDSRLILWDARVGTSPAIMVETAHNGGLLCVDWNHNDENLILTGSYDKAVRLFDRRKLTSGTIGSPTHIFEGHSAPVLCVQWCPNKASVFGSAAVDGLLNVWDHDKFGKEQDCGEPGSTPPGLFFKHAGHRDTVVDFHWNPEDPWTIVSLSDGCDTPENGGTLQVWRIRDDMADDDKLLEYSKTPKVTRRPKRDIWFGRSSSKSTKCHVPLTRPLNFCRT